MRRYKRQEELLPTSLSEALSLPCKQFFKCSIPLTVLFSAGPTYLSAWLAVRALTLLTPKTRQMFCSFDDFIWSSYQRLILFFAENWTHTEVLFYGDADRLVHQGKTIKENTIFMCNHQCSFDWIVADMVAVRFNCLGNIRYVLKSSLRFIPLYGYYFKQHGCVYVKRGGYDADSYKMQLLNLAKKDVFWLVIFPEGTRYSAQKKKVIEANQKYAEKFGLPTFDFVLTPRHRGFYHAMQSLEDHVDAVYDVTIAYEPPGWKPDGNQPRPPSIASYLTGSTSKVHIHMERIPRQDIPTDEAKFSAWLCERFRIKNEFVNLLSGIFTCFFF